MGSKVHSPFCVTCAAFEGGFEVLDALDTYLYRLRCSEMSSLYCLALSMVCAFIRACAHAIDIVIRIWIYVCKCSTRLGMRAIFVGQFDETCALKFCTSSPMEGPITKLHLPLSMQTKSPCAAAAAVGGAWDLMTCGMHKPRTQTLVHTRS